MGMGSIMGMEPTIDIGYTMGVGFTVGYMVTIAEIDPKQKASEGEEDGEKKLTGKNRNYSLPLARSLPTTIPEASASPSTRYGGRHIR